jgi:hypothetical protein
VPVPHIAAVPPPATNQSALVVVKVTPAAEKLKQTVGLVAPFA